MKNKVAFLYISVTLIAVCFVFTLCTNSNSAKEDAPKKIDNAFLKEKMIESNKHLSRTENNQIDSYIERRGWKQMRKLGNGVRIWEYEKGKGIQIQKQQKVSIKYKLELINGMLIYSSDVDGVKSFTLGKAEIERGLEETIPLLHRGSKAKIIIPSYLGYGFVGDGDRIPKYAILIYDIEVL